MRKKDTGRVYALKSIRKAHIVSRSEVTHTLAERTVLAQVNNPFIVPLKFSFQSKDKLYLVLSFVNGGELFHHLQNEGRFDEERSKFYAAELLCALECLHSFDVVYRDLKPENILLDYTGHLMLCDFGLCKLNMTEGERTNTFAGTPEYLAPELILGKGYTRRVDWWTLGVLLYEMLSGLPAFFEEDHQKMYQRSEQPPLPPTPSLPSLTNSSPFRSHQRDAHLPAHHHRRSPPDPNRPPAEGPRPPPRRKRGRGDQAAPLLSRPRLGKARPARNHPALQAERRERDRHGQRRQGLLERGPDGQCG